MESLVVCLALMTMASVVYMIYSHQSTLQVYRTTHLNEAISELLDQPCLTKKLKVSAQESKGRVQASTPASAVAQSQAESFEEIPAKRPRDFSLSSQVTNRLQTGLELEFSKPSWRMSELDEWAHDTHNESGTPASQPFFGEGTRLPPPRSKAPHSGLRLGSQTGTPAVSIPHFLPVNFQATRSNLLTNDGSLFQLRPESKPLQQSNEDAFRVYSSDLRASK